MGLTHSAVAAGRIGIFGGAFDPPHRAHLALARTAVVELRLDRLHVVPTGHAWHKTRSLSHAGQRLAMARLAFADVPQVVVDDRELRRAGPTFSIDTLEELQAENPGAELHLLIGGDQAAALTSWHRWEDLVRLAIISIAHRADAACAEGPWGFETLPGARVRPLHLPDSPVSATGIRARVAESGGIDHLVTPGVARYIDQHLLYRPAR